MSALESQQQNWVEMEMTVFQTIVDPERAASMEDRLAKQRTWTDEQMTTVRRRMDDIDAKIVRAQCRLATLGGAHEPECVD